MKSKITDTKGELRLAQQLCFALYSTSRAFTKQYGAILGDLGLTYPQYVAMMVLWEQDGILVQELAKRMEIEGPTATPLIQRLEKQGLVVRTRNAEDERKVLVFLTEKGSHLFEKARAVPAKIGQAVGLNANEASKLTKELNRIRANIGPSK
ncbi:MarR family winged helix-turn-helix transcriptional regulator [Agarilytica rhodophyticola]|uniref:MarR family winged helix-turn-helix transcriptional regulator n=1 Tax=Agarilytica rhodophyticola TaxID=1737490 RepID=UPI001C2012E7|nr:MarR family transcriptional regulator [Agarilytica rhodophyticola]